MLGHRLSQDGGTLHDFRHLQGHDLSTPKLGWDTNELKYLEGVSNDPGTETHNWMSDLLDILAACCDVERAADVDVAAKKGSETEQYSGRIEQQETTGG